MATQTLERVCSGEDHSPRRFRIGPAALALALSLALTSCASTAGPSRPVFYPPAPSTPRIQYLATYNSPADFGAEVGRFERWILGRPPHPPLGKVYGVAMHDGKIFVCETTRNTVVIFDLVAKSMELMGHLRSSPLKKPVNIAIAEDGTRYVADTGHQRVMIYDSTNEYVTAFGDPGQWTPSDVAVLEERLYVTDRLNAQVFVLDRNTGREVRRFSRKGSAKEELNVPTGIDVDSDENIYVTDTAQARVAKFSARGDFLQQVGTRGRGVGQFVRPKGVGVDREGRLFVVDAAFKNVQIFNEQGELLLFFPDTVEHPGSLVLPADLAIDYENVGLFADRVAPGHELEYLILITSQYGARKVNVYGFLKQGEE
jgi:DNA-binding beta-propeller fold protein YncE